MQMMSSILDFRLLFKKGEEEVPIPFGAFTSFRLTISMLCLFNTIDGDIVRTSLSVS